MKYLFLIFLASALLSCNRQIQFDQVAWATKDDMLPCACREQMLDDLTKQYQLIGLRKIELETLLGEPDYRDTNTFSYAITEQYGTDIDPIYTKTMVFNLDKNGAVSSFQVREWKK